MASIVTIGHLARKLKKEEALNPGEHGHYPVDICQQFFAVRSRHALRKLPVIELREFL